MGKSLYVSKILLVTIFCMALTSSFFVLEVQAQEGQKCGVSIFSLKPCPSGYKCSNPIMGTCKKNPAATTKEADTTTILTTSAADPTTEAEEPEPETTTPESGPDPEPET